MPWEYGLLAIAIHLEVLSAVFEGCTVLAQPFHEFALFHHPPFVCYLGTHIKPFGLIFKGLFKLFCLISGEV